METLSVKLEEAQSRWLASQAQALGRSRGRIVRDLIERERESVAGPTLKDRLQDLCGVLRGPRNLSTRKLNARYGRD